MAGIPFAGLEAVTALVSRIKGKTDKIASPTNDNLVAMDANGNIKDGEVKRSDVEYPKVWVSRYHDAETIYKFVFNTDTQCTFLLHIGYGATILLSKLTRDDKYFAVLFGTKNGSWSSSTTPVIKYDGNTMYIRAGADTPLTITQLNRSAYSSATITMSTVESSDADYTAATTLVVKRIVTSEIVSLTASSTNKLITTQEATTQFMSSPATFVVNSNETLAAWAAHTAGNDYSSVYIASGTYTLASGGINLTAAGTKQVEGHPSSKLVFEALTPVDGNYSAALYYTSRPTDPSYNIKNVNVECTGAPATSANNYPCAFRNCVNLTNCSGFAKATGTKAYQAAYAFYGCQNLSFCFGASSGANNGNAYTFSASSYLTNCTADETAYPAAYDSKADIIPYASCSYLVNCVSKAKNGYELTRGFFGCSYLTGCHAEMTQDASTTVTEITGFNRCSRISNCHAKITDNSGKTLTNIGGFINSTMIDNCTSEGGQIYNSSYVAKCNATAYTQSYSDNYVTAAANTAAGGWNHTGILTWKNNRWENA